MFLEVVEIWLRAGLLYMVQVQQMAQKKKLHKPQDQGGCLAKVELMHSDWYLMVFYAIMFEALSKRDACLLSTINEHSTNQSKSKNAQISCHTKRLSKISVLPNETREKWCLLRNRLDQSVLGSKASLRKWQVALRPSNCASTKFHLTSAAHLAADKCSVLIN